MLGRVIRKLVASGINEIIVNVHHFADQVKDYISATEFGIPVSISDESEHLLDTGGGILKAKGFLNGLEPFVVHNADILTDFDLSRMIENHMASGADATLMASPRATSRYLFFDTDNRLCGWCNEKNGATRPDGFAPAPDMKKLAFGGVHVLSPSIFDVLEHYATPDTPFSITNLYVDSIDTLDIRAFTPEENFIWCDIGNPESLERANNLIAKQS